MESLSSYDKGKKSFEGRRYKADIEVAHKGMNMLFAPIEAKNKNLAAAKKTLYKPRKILTLGNHECYSLDTQVLTDKGWKLVGTVTEEDQVASFDARRTIKFNPPVAIQQWDNVPLIHLKGHFSNELVSFNHKFIVDGQRTELKVGDRIQQQRLTLSGFTPNTANNYFSDDEIRLLAWAVMDGCVYWSTPGKVRIQFKLSKQRKIKTLVALLTKMGIPFTFKETTKSGLNKLQPYFIRIYGEAAKNIATKIAPRGTVKSLPLEFSSLSEEQTRILINTIAETDGTKSYNNSITWNTTSLGDAELVQLACIKNGMLCTVSGPKSNRGGFVNSKPQVKVRIWEQGVSNKYYAEVIEAGFGPVIGIQTVDGTLVTRREGIVAFTGNSRIERSIEEDPKLDGTIGLQDLQYEKWGWEVYPFLEPVTVDGITYCHYFSTGVMGRPVTSARALVKAKHSSAIMGHVQTTDIYMGDTRADGRSLTGMFVGICYLHDEAYLSPQANKTRRQIVMLHEVEDGEFDPMLVSLKFLKRKYGA